MSSRSVIVVVCRSAPLVAVTVNVKTPLGPDAAVLRVSVEADVVGFGANVTVEPDGCPLRPRATEPLNPFSGVTVTE